MAAPELAASKLPQAQASGHRIVDVTAHCLRLPYRGEVQFARMKQASAEYSHRRHHGLTTAPKASRRRCAGRNSPARTARAIAYMIDTFFKPMVVGADPLHHLTILDKLDRIRDCRAAKSLIDIALWDLRGKLLGQPVWRLLGGGPAQAGAADLGGARQYPRGEVEEAKRMVLERGYKGLKLKVWQRSDEDVALVREVRSAVGDALTIYVDANSKYTEFEVRTILSKIADYRVDFIEDPCRSADLTRMALLAQALPIAILGDLHCNSLDAVQAHLSARAVGGISVKLRRTGITESLKIIALCEAAGIPMVIGTDSESRIGAMPRVHLRMAIPSLADAPIETHFFDKLASDVFAGEFGFEDGAITPTDAPGFGAAIDRRMLETFGF